MKRNLLAQSTHETSLIPIIGGARNVNTTISGDNTDELDGTVDIKEVRPELKGKHLLGPILGGLGIFIILVFYLLGQRKEEREKKEKALQETRKEERKRKLLKDSMNIESFAGVSTPCIDDEEAQHDQAIFKRCEEQQQDGDEYCSTTDDSLDDHSHSVMDQSSSCSKKTQLQDVMCPICHEQYQDGDELASSRNEACCHTVFHSECIISWLMTDHKECPICRSEFVVENMESED